MQGSFNGKPKATFPLSFDETVAFGLPLNEFMRPLSTTNPGIFMNSGVSGICIFQLARRDCVAAHQRVRDQSLRVQNTETTEYE